MDEKNIIAWDPSMSRTLQNANGAVDDSSLGYQYTIQTTTQIRAQVIEQKFYEVPPAEFMDMPVGTGAFLEDIKTNIEYQASGGFEQGIQGNASQAQISNVDVATSPKSAVIKTWVKGYQYNTLEVKKALAANNWDAIRARMKTLKKVWDLGIQKIAFMGLLSDPTNVPGLLSNAEVTVDTATITEYLKSMSTTNFTTLVENLLAAYFANSNSTVLPNMFVIPMADYLGLARPYSPDFPLQSKLTYLKQAFEEICGPGFQIKGLAYADQAHNTGYWETLGTNRYVLYRKDPEVVRMDIPVDIILNPAATGDNFNWNAVGLGQFTGAIVYRTPEVLYFDWAA